MPGDAPTGAQDVAGDGELVGGGTYVASGVVEDEVFEVNQFAINPR
ncbi:hypothetical protein EKH55_5649 (plasmid) [Sinorhizobium alkalisoli]|nr:hypothetical protein EKH55_5649 [Sinorhizobium alkalisoli]